MGVLRELRDNVKGCSSSKIDYIHMLTETSILLKNNYTPRDVSNIELFVNSIMMDFFTYVCVDNLSDFDRILQEYSDDTLNNNYIIGSISDINRIILNIIAMVSEEDDIFDLGVFFMMHLDLVYLLSGDVRRYVK